MAELNEMAAALDALGAEVRLHILRQLAVPKTAGMIRVLPKSGPRADASPMSRQALSRHLKRLLEAGLILELPDEGDGTRYVAGRSRLFEVLESTRALGEVDHLGAAEDETRLAKRAPARKRRRGRELVLVKGVGEGRVFPLDASVHMGRSRDAEVCLDYDPFVSSLHARLHVDGRRVSVQTLATATNPAYLNGREVPSDDEVPLRSGDILELGLSTLVFRD